MATTQLAHQPMGWFGNQQLTDPLNSLFGCARMVHVSSLRAVSLFLLSPYLSGMLLATFPPIVTVVPALFEPCLTLEKTLLYSFVQSKQRGCDLDEFSEILVEFLDLFSNSYGILRLISHHSRKGKAVCGIL
jgi:hypothetical protein